MDVWFDYASHGIMSACAAAAPISFMVCSVECHNFGYSALISSLWNCLSCPLERAELFVLPRAALQEPTICYHQCFFGQMWTAYLRIIALMQTFFFRLCSQGISQSCIWHGALILYKNMSILLVWSAPMCSHICPFILLNMEWKPQPRFLYFCVHNFVVKSIAQFTFGVHRCAPGLEAKSAVRKS